MIKTALGFSKTLLSEKMVWWSKFFSGVALSTAALFVAYCLSLGLL